MVKLTPVEKQSLRSYCDADAGPSNVPTKRGRGRPKGSKNSMLTANPVPARRGRGRPIGSRSLTTTRRRRRSRKVTSFPNFNSRITEEDRQTGNKELVDSVLMRFDAARRRLLQINYRRDLLKHAETNCMNLGVNTNSMKRTGLVPGVEIGDIFYYWGEMKLVGLHQTLVKGINYLKAPGGGEDGHVALSVVTSGKYNDETEDVDSLVYTGQGSRGNQKLKEGNLALEASQRLGNEVRVIRSEKDPKSKNKNIYIYDGVYFVSKWWKVKGDSGFDEFKFLLVRKRDQPLGYAIWKLAEKLREEGSSNLRKGFILEDLSFGKEDKSVLLLNELDESNKETPPAFDYISSPCHPSLGLDLNNQLHICGKCQGQSCSSYYPKCVCVQRNGGELAYRKSFLLCRKPLVYECGSSCSCDEINCENRVVQSKLEIPMEVFKTAKCGWGLRSLEPIRAGMFICEFVGVKMTKEEVEEDDDYLFDTSRICNHFKWNYEPELVAETAGGEQVTEDFNLPTQVLISAKESGNVGRFINHSCSPNVFWQAIEYEKDYISSTRIGFFAKKHIPPLTELTYDYGVSAVEKIGEDETIFKGKKICFCGSIKCRGSFG